MSKATLLGTLALASCTSSHPKMKSFLPAQVQEIVLPNKKVQVEYQVSQVVDIKAEDGRENRKGNPEEFTKSSIVQETSLEERIQPEYNFNLTDLERYQNWIEETIEYSRKNKTSAIIVDKANYSLDFYKNGEILKTFPVEFGFNPFDDKMMEGDGTTPEGKYHVSKVKDKGHTSFYRAFLINYPNGKDWKEFLQWKKEGIIPKNATIGGAIEIHGHGSGKAGDDGGHNWTAGCMAMSNEDIDELFPYVQRRTPVTIVKYGTRIKSPALIQRQ